jgi:hypothetical protein
MERGEIPVGKKLPGIQVLVKINIRKPPVFSIRETVTTPWFLSWINHLNTTS